MGSGQWAVGGGLMLISHGGADQQAKADFTEWWMINGKRQMKAD